MSPISRIGNSSIGGSSCGGKRKYTQPNDRKKGSPILDLFKFFGYEFKVNGSAEALAEACPWCGKDKFHVNVDTGLYNCKPCGESGNATTFLTWIHAEHLAQTTTEHYLTLKQKRGIATQTLRLHELAYDGMGCWYIPFKNRQGNIVNMQLYYPA